MCVISLDDAGTELTDCKTEWNHDYPYFAPSVTKFKQIFPAFIKQQHFKCLLLKKFTEEFSLSISIII